MVAVVPPRRATRMLPSVVALRLVIVRLFAIDKLSTALGFHVVF